MISKRSNNPLLSIRLKEAGARLIFVFLFLLLTTTNAPLYAESTNQNIRIRYKENVLSIWAKDADLKKVLFELSDETNINIRLPLSLDKKITINRSGISLSEGLADILKHLNYAILYSGTKNNKPLISKIIVFPKSKISTTSTGGERQRASSEKQSTDSKAKLDKRLKLYERQIKSLKERLSKVDENSRRGKSYLRKIKRVEELIEKLESQLN